MIFLKIVHMYQFLGAFASCFFSFYNRETIGILPFCVSIAFTAFLFALFFFRTQNRLFYSLIIIHILQLVSFKTATFGYLSSLGVGLYIQFNVEHFSVYQFLATLAIIDFSPITSGEPLQFSVNILVLVMTSFLTLTKEKKYMQVNIFEPWNL